MEKMQLAAWPPQKVATSRPYFPMGLMGRASAPPANNTQSPMADTRVYSRVKGSRPASRLTAKLPSTADSATALSAPP